MIKGQFYQREIIARKHHFAADGLPT